MRKMDLFGIFPSLLLFSGVFVFLTAVGNGKIIKGIFAFDRQCSQFVGGCGARGCSADERPEIFWTCTSASAPGDCNCEHDESDLRCTSSPACVTPTCNPNNWGSWSACSKACGGGVQTRTNECGQSQTQACNTQPCPTNTPAASPTSTEVISPTVTEGPSPTATPTPDPNCLCGSDNQCASVCVFDKYQDNPYASLPVSCSLPSDVVHPSTPSAQNKNDWCRRNLRTKGDADGNAIVDMTDYFYYVAAVNGGKIPVVVNPDFNGDGEIGVADRTIILRTLQTNQ